MPPYFGLGGAPGRTRTCGPLLSFQHQAFPDRPSKLGLLAGLYLGRLSPDPYSLWGSPSAT